jgi:metallo-beta-lactamase family protein
MGRRLADREKFVKIFGYTFKVKAEIATIGGLSAHAGQDLLVEYALRLKGKAKQVNIVHGEPKAAKILMGELDKNGLQHVFYPELHAYTEI